MKYYDRDVCTLSGLYDYILYHCNPDGGKRLHEREIKKVRALVDDWYIPHLSKDFTDKIGEKVPFADLFAFLKSNNEELERRREQTDYEWKNTENLLGEKEARALSTLKNNYISPVFMHDSGSVIINAGEGDSYRMLLVLENAEIPLNISENCHPGGNEWTEFSEKDGVFTLDIIYSDCEQDEGETIINFTSARLETQVYSALYTVLTNPAEYLFSLSGEFLDKKGRGVPMKESEKALLPLCEALYTLLGVEKHEDLNDCDKSAVLSYIDEDLKSGFISRMKKPEKLKAFICKSEFEPSWQRIYKAFVLSQSDYPKKSDKLCEKVYLERTRAEITEKIKSFGFDGEYPDFVKKAPLEKSRLIESYGITYFIGKGKELLHRIHCVEYYSNGLSVDFLCGSAENCGIDDNIFSYMFNEGGKRYITLVSAYMPKKTPEYMETFPTPEEYASVACKKALLLSLSKEEKKSHFYESGYLKLLPTIGLYLFSGVLFGVILTVGFMLVEFLISLLSKNPFAEFSRLFLGTRWLLIFAFSSVTFSICMIALIVVSARKKK